MNETNKPFSEQVDEYKENPQKVSRLFGSIKTYVQGFARESGMSEREARNFLNKNPELKENFLQRWVNRKNK